MKDPKNLSPAYAKRLASGLARGLSSDVASGHPKKTSVSASTRKLLGGKPLSKEYSKRLLSGIKRGLTRSVASGKPKGNEFSAAMQRFIAKGFDKKLHPELAKIVSELTLNPNAKREISKLYAKNNFKRPKTLPSPYNYVPEQKPKSPKLKKLGSGELEDIHLYIKRVKTKKNKYLHYIYDEDGNSYAVFNTRKNALIRLEELEEELGF